MAAAAADPDNPGIWVQRLEDHCRREAMEIRLRAIADAEDGSAQELAAANGMIERRIARLRELRNELAEGSARIERDLIRAATEIKRRSDDQAGGRRAAAPAAAVTYPAKP